MSMRAMADRCFTASAIAVRAKANNTLYRIRTQQPTRKVIAMSKDAVAEKPQRHG